MRVLPGSTATPRAFDLRLGIAARALSPAAELCQLRARRVQLESTATRRGLVRRQGIARLEVFLPWEMENLRFVFLVLQVFIVYLVAEVLAVMELVHPVAFRRQEPVSIHHALLVLLEPSTRNSAQNL